MQKKKIIIGIVVIILIGLGIILNQESNNSTVNNYNDVNNDSNISVKQIIVDVKGEVKRPGIYYLNENSRVIDAINAAGGLTNNADTSNINLAMKLEDGTSIYILKKVEKDVTQSKISINKATIDELMQLPGIGEVKARKIVEYRLKNGYFLSLEDLLKVDGINENLYKQIKEYICL